MVSQPATVEREVIARIERVLRRPVRPSDDLVADLGLDSLTLTALAVELEDQFLIRLDDVDPPPRTVGEIVACVVERAP